jgi:hypothetical protein
MSSPALAARPNRAKTALTLNVDFDDVLEQLQPEPAGLLEGVRAYLDRRTQKDAESVHLALDAEWLRRREQWLVRVGKLLPANEVARFSPSMKTRAAVHKAHKDGRLLAVEIGDRVFFPQFQFGEDGVARPWVRDLAAALPDSDTRLQFIAASRPALKGRSYAAVLREDPDPPTIAGMLKVAREQAAAEAR